MIKNKRLIIFFIFILTFLSICLIENSVEAVKTSTDINGINESKYPGYKALIKSLQSKHPSWNFVLHYTGLDWNEVIDSEYSNHGANLVPTTDSRYNGDWHCTICNGNEYETGWTCPSKAALEYMMDPRNSINETDVFQFQSLSESSASKEAIVAMCDGTFLSPYVDTIIEAGSTHKVSPYHLVARMLQEKGHNPDSLIVGTDEDGSYYNFYNIGAYATGNLTIEQNSMKTAKQNGWTTPEASILGGAEYVAKKYIAIGQDTLYFQKFDVIGPDYYNHQYMANILAAQNEGTEIRESYIDVGILDSSFTFIIPIYENMPKSAASRPLNTGSTYVGNINSELKSFSLGKSNGNSYFSGEIIIVEWVDGKSTVPSVKPIIRLKSTDGKVSLEAFVTATGTNTYYFDRFIEGIDTSKQYIFELSSGDDRNISENRTMDIIFPTKTIGKYGDYQLYFEKNQMKFGLNVYVGDINSELKSFKLGSSGGNAYVSGEIIVVEWVNGKSTVPSAKPIMRFKSTDGKVDLEVFVTATGTNTYYFDRFIEGIDTSKQYIFEISSGDKKNISPNKSMNVYFKNQNIGNYHDYILYLNSNRIKFKLDTYVGNINSELKKISLGSSGGNAYVSGEIVVVEWVNGKSTVPSVKPIMKLKSTDGKVSLEVFVTATGTNTYYFDRFIEGIDTSKQYILEVSSGSSKNTSKNKTMNVYLKDQTLGNYRNYALFLEDNKVKFGKL